VISAMGSKRRRAILLFGFITWNHAESIREEIYLPTAIPGPFGNLQITGKKLFHVALEKNARGERHQPFGKN